MEDRGVRSLDERRSRDGARGSDPVVDTVDGRATGARHARRAHGEGGGPVAMTVVERVVALHDVPLFAAVPGRTLAAVAARSTEVRVDEGDVVIAEGSVDDHLFVVVRGRLRAAHDGVVLRDLPAGSTVGELAALVPEPRSATVTALEPALLLRIDKPVLDELLADHPELAAGVITTLVGMLRSAAGAGDGHRR